MTTPAEDMVRTAAELARLELEPGERAALALDFEAILGAFRALQEVDVGAVPPMTTGAGTGAGAGELTDVLREDVPRPGLEPDEALAQAPEPHDGFFGVPRVLGGEAGSAK